MSKHTPGPWSYDNDENEVHSDSMQDSGGDPAHICEMIGVNWAANGKLIAAAPEMLDMLKRIYNGEHRLDYLIDVDRLISIAEGNS